MLKVVVLVYIAKQFLYINMKYLYSKLELEHTEIGLADYENFKQGMNIMGINTFGLTLLFFILAIVVALKGWFE